MLTEFWFPPTLLERSLVREERQYVVSPRSVTQGRTDCYIYSSSQVVITFIQASKSSTKLTSFLVKDKEVKICYFACIYDNCLVMPKIHFSTKIVLVAAYEANQSHYIVTKQTDL